MQTLKIQTEDITRNASVPREPEPPDMAALLARGRALQAQAFHQAVAGVAQRIRRLIG